MTPRLSPAAADHLDFLLDQESKRREIDPKLPVVEARETMLGAATNLESGQPTPEMGVPNRLRAAADLLIEQDVVCRDFYTQQSVNRLVNAPRLRVLAEQVRRMAHDDADLVANSLVVIANRLST